MASSWPDGKALSTSTFTEVGGGNAAAWRRRRVAGAESEKGQKN